MYFKKAQLIIYLSTGLFLIVDRFFKYQSLYAWAKPHLVNKYLGWQPFLNPGIGFGLPVPNAIIVALTVPILALIIYLFVKTLQPGSVTATPGKHGNTSTWKHLDTISPRPTVPCPSSPFPSFPFPLSPLLILTGALSNFVDRVIYHHTVDYLLTATSLYNLADVMIVGGFVIYLLKTLNPKL